MKRVVLAVLLLLTVVILCWTSLYLVQQISDTAAAYVDSATAAIELGDRSRAEQQLNEAYVFWKSKRPLLGSVLQHEELDEIDRLFSASRQALSFDSTDDYHIHAAQLRMMLFHLPKLETPLTENVF